jgi:hypothetical protein
MTPTLRGKSRYIRYNVDSQILADYPDLEADDLKAACAYGARLSQVKRIEPLAA